MWQIPGAIVRGLGWLLLGLFLLAMLAVGVVLIVLGIKEGDGFLAIVGVFVVFIVVGFLFEEGVVSVEMFMSKERVAKRHSQKQIDDRARWIRGRMAREGSAYSNEDRNRDEGFQGMLQRRHDVRYGS